MKRRINHLYESEQLINSHNEDFMLRTNKLQLYTIALKLKKEI